jgi:TolB-like protein/tetratricopeptide (TPR) repeat protein
MTSRAGPHSMHGSKGAGVSDTSVARLKIFISYARADRAWAERLIRALGTERFDIWYDGLLEGGENFLPTTESALEGADAVLVLWSATSIASHWVRDEATSGRDRRRLVPISIDGSMAPLGFRQFQVIDMAAWSGKPDADSVHKVISAIHSVAGAPAPAAPRAAARPAPAGGVDRRLLLAGGGLVLAAGGGFFAWQHRGGDAPDAASANSVAVLPFRNLSGDSSRDYFADGLTEELRSTLSFNRQLLVSGAGSAGGFRATDLDARQIARALGVTNLLTGSVRQTPQRVRIAARLVDGTNGFERWSQTFDRAVADVLAVQTEIATFVTDALISTLAKNPNWRAERPGSTRNAGAFDAYLQGGRLYSLGQTATDRQALAAYDKAIALDPRYATAHAARAQTLVAIANQEPNMARGNAMRSAALAGARKAIALAPTMDTGHITLGFLSMSQLDIAAAQPAYQRGFELGYGDAPALLACAEFFANIGAFDKAKAAISRARLIDPLNPGVFFNSALVALSTRDFTAARAALTTVEALRPGRAIVQRMLGDMALVSGDVAGAHRHYQNEPSRLSKLRGLAITEARLNGAAAGEAQMARLVAEYGDGGLYQQGQVLAQWGRIDDALATLEKALALRDSGLILARGDPLLDPLRKQPRFAAILARIGLSPPS